MGYPAFSIKKGGKVVATVRGGKVETDDETISGWITTGVVTRTGGSDKSGKAFWEGTKLTTPDQPDFFLEFVSALVNSGYDVPLWLLQSLAR